jgi:hypothetical protein
MDRDTVAFNAEGKTWEVRLYEDVEAMSKYLAQSMKVDRIEDLLRDRIITRVTAEVMTEKIHEQVWTIEESPSYETPKHAWLATMREGSFRQRFWSYFWGIYPPFGKAVRHEVVVKRWVNRPDIGIPQQSVEMGFWV